MTPDSIESLFTRDSGAFVFARWGRPIAPIVFGVEEPTLRVVKGAFEAVAALAGHSLAETDPELGSNCMVFFFRDWAELSEVPDLDRLIPDLGPLVARLTAAKANQYRVFRFDDSGAIQAAFVFLRMDPALAAQPAEELALSQVVQVMLLWSERAFAAQSPLAIAGQKVILRPEIAGVIRAAYDPVLPAAARDPSHALRLFARLEAAP
ncbi:hypothetical protein CVM52_24335 [Pseudooceanicola lipolyticus]|uniref:Uncharacterized protein n=1 Tax=Pseudooceanicola lipolyticus TaxID=2029104 RepID=A0A2M8IU44_9RHOB|nr:hypothetical protein [Pseudooceanicola lipolyticus]PJE34038.1 hypothetical protein CVM52_24335 [Pseudooceanicola lipolyticus]